MRIGTADETQLKRVNAGGGFEGEPVFQHIAQQVSRCKLLNANRLSAIGAHDAVNAAEHVQIVAVNLFKVTELILRQYPSAHEPVKAALAGAFVLNHFCDGLQATSQGRLLGAGGVWEHQPPGEITVMWNS